MLPSWRGMMSLVVVGRGGSRLDALGRARYDDAADAYARDVVTQLTALKLYPQVADALEAFVRAGRAREAAALLEEFSSQAAEAGWPWALARSAHLGALVAPSTETFDEALRLHVEAGQAFPRARTELAYGEWLRRAGHRIDARVVLHAALETFERLGAAPWAEHAAAELRATGERVRRRSDPDTSQLTPQELQVALVVARGATNKEAAAQLYLSPKTIEKHLGSVYTKLGLRSRTELAGVLGTLSPGDVVAVV
jgi:DNA-binding CsgD family transcriptional regulator